MGFSLGEIIVIFVMFLSGFLEMTILIEVISSFFGKPWEKGKFRLFIENVNSPFLDIIRRYVPPQGGWDFSPLIAILILEIAPQLLITLLSVNYSELMNKIGIN